MEQESRVRVNREGLTWEEFAAAVGPAWACAYGHIRTRTRTQSSYRNNGINYGIVSTLPPGVFHYIYGSKTRSPLSVIRRAWEKGEDPSELRAWAEKQLRRKAA